MGVRGGLDRSRLLAAVVLYGIVAILLHRLLIGTLVYYINPRYEWLTWVAVAVAVAGLAAMVLALTGTAWRRARDSRRLHGMRVGWSALAVFDLTGRERAVIAAAATPRWLP